MPCKPSLHGTCHPSAAPQKHIPGHSTPERCQHPPQLIQNSHQRITQPRLYPSTLFRVLDSHFGARGRRRPVTWNAQRAGTLGEGVTLPSHTPERCPPPARRQDGRQHDCALPLRGEVGAHTQAVQGIDGVVLQLLLLPALLGLAKHKTRKRPLMHSCSHVLGHTHMLVQLKHSCSRVPGHTHTCWCKYSVPADMHTRLLLARA